MSAFLGGVNPLLRQLLGIGRDLKALLCNPMAASPRSPEPQRPVIWTQVRVTTVPGRPNLPTPGPMLAST
jgi:hypothetical protein